MNARIAIPSIIVVAVVALIIGAVTGVMAVIVFAAVGLVAAIVGGIWTGRKVTSTAKRRHSTGTSGGQTL